MWMECEFANWKETENGALTEIMLQPSMNIWKQPKIHPTSSTSNPVFLICINWSSGFRWRNQDCYIEGSGDKYIYNLNFKYNNR